MNFIPYNIHFIMVRYGQAIWVMWLHTFKFCSMWRQLELAASFGIFASLSKETQQLKRMRTKFLHISSHCKIKNPYPSTASSAFEHFQRQLYKYFEYFVWNLLAYYYFCHIANLILRIRGLSWIRTCTNFAGMCLAELLSPSWYQFDSLGQWLCMQMINKKHYKYWTKTRP